MNRCLVVATALLLSSVFPASEALAAIRTHAFNFSVMGGGYFFESDERLENSQVYTLGVGYNFSERWGGEIITGHISTRDVDQSELIDGYPLRLDVLYSFRPKERLIPHLAVGLGGLLLNDPDGDTDLESVVAYGFGLRYFVSRSLALRADIRHLFVRQNFRFEKGEGSNHLMANAGVTVQVGGRMIPPPQIDSDGDGVIDAFDRCPGTPLGVPVDVYGCPADSDGDGVPDYRDLCPDTPFGVKVDEHGCPIEGEEGAAVIADFSPPPAAVSFAPTARPSISRLMEELKRSKEGNVEKAPAQRAQITLLIPFAPGRAELRHDSGEELKNAVDFVQMRRDRFFVVEGHTDSIGGADANLDLSLQRAEAVRRYLLQETGIAPERIEVRGYGQTRPVGDNATQEGRHQNRRIVIKEQF